MSLFTRSKAETKKGTEKLPSFKATPEVIGQFLERKTEQVAAQMVSVEEREKLFQELMKNKKYLSEVHDFNPAEVRRQMDLVGETLAAKGKYMLEVHAPEKRGLFRRVWDTVKKHPVKTVLVVAALAAAGYATWYYAGNAIMAWLHSLSQVAPQGVMNPAFEAPATIPAAPVAPTGPWDLSSLPTGLQ